MSILNMQKTVEASIHASEVKAKKAIVGVHSPNTIRLLRFDTAFEIR